MAASSRPVDVILLKSTAAVSAAAMFVGDRTMASTLLAGAAAVVCTRAKSAIYNCFVYIVVGLE